MTSSRRLRLDRFSAPLLLAIAACAVDSGAPPASGDRGTEGASPPAPYFWRAGLRVVATPSASGVSVVLAEGAGAPHLDGEVARAGDVAVVRGGAAAIREAARHGRVLPAYALDRGAARFPTGNLYLKPAAGTPPEALAPVLRRHRLELVARLSVPEWVYVRTSSDPVVAARALVESGDATASEPSFFVATKLHGPTELTGAAPDDPYYAEQWNIQSSGPFRSPDGKAEVRGADHAHVGEAWGLLARLGRATAIDGIGGAVRLAVIDDGFDLEHEDLRGKFVASKNFGGPVEPGTLFSNSAPKNFHGTMVTGIAAATANNGLGIAGACPGCRLIGARMAAAAPDELTPDQYYDQIFDWVMTQSPDIINCSWGPDAGLPSSYFDALVTRITTAGRGGKGTILVFASGNSGEDFAWNALASHPRSITVGASDSTGRRHGFSNYGAGLDLVAPTSGGEKASGFSTRYIDRIWSTDNYLRPACLGATATPTSSCSDTSGWTPSSPMAGGDRWEGKYSFRFSHTSAAAPLVSGVIGVMLHANPRLTADEVQTILHETADHVAETDARYDASGFSPNYGHGRVNALRAVARALEAGGAALDSATKQEIEAASPCTRPSCGGATRSPDAPAAPDAAAPPGRRDAGSAAPPAAESPDAGEAAGEADPMSDPSAAPGASPGTGAAPARVVGEPEREAAPAPAQTDGGCNASGGPPALGGASLVVAVLASRRRRRS